MIELKTNEMRTFGPDKSTSSAPSTPYTQLVTTPSELDVCVSPIFNFSSVSFCWLWWKWNYLDKISYFEDAGIGYKLQCEYWVLISPWICILCEQDLHSTPINCLWCVKGDFMCSLDRQQIEVCRLVFFLPLRALIFHRFRFLLSFRDRFLSKARYYIKTDQWRVYFIQDRRICRNII